MLGKALDADRRGVLQTLKSWPIHIAGLSCFAGYAALAWYSRGHFGEPSLVVFFVLIAWVAVSLVLLYTLREHGTRAITIGAVIGWAVVFRMCGLWCEPLFEDDFFRYLWDGYRFAQDWTPYADAPAQYFNDIDVPIGFQRILDQVNYPDIPTIYGPTTELLFLVSYAIQPGSLVPLKLALIFFDVVLIWLLSTEAKPRLVMLYAWCPLVVNEISFAAHPDVLGILLVIAAFLLAKRGRLNLAVLSLALAIGAKVFAVLFVPFLLINTDIRSKLAFIAALILMYLPFVVQGSTELSALVIFTQEWSFNASVFEVMTVWIEPLVSRLILGVVFASLYVGYWLHYIRNEQGSIPRGDWIFGVFLLLAPVVNPWYVLWLLPFAVIYPSFWAWIAGYSVMLSYITWINLGNFELDPFAQPLWVRLVEYGTILFALFWTSWQNGSRSKNSYKV